MKKQKGRGVKPLSPLDKSIVFFETIDKRNRLKYNEIESEVTTMNTVKKILTIAFAIILVGLVGRMDYESEVMTTKQDEINKQEVIKDFQIRCMNNEPGFEMYCKE